MNNLAQIEYDDTPPPFDDIDTATLKMPPHSLEAEQSVLGGLLIRGQLFDDVSEIVSAEDFFQPRHRELFEAMGRVSRSGDGIDVVTVAENTHDIDRLGGIAYLAELVVDTPAVANIRAYAKVVRERSTLRTLIEAAQRIADSGFNPDGRSSAEILAEAQGLIMGIGEVEAETQLYGNPALAAWVESVDERFRGGGCKGLMTGLREVDKRTNGLQPADLVIVAGRPSMGKSTLAFQIAGDAAVNDQAVMVFSMEMPRNQIYDKVGAGLGKIPLERMKTGQLQNEDWAALTGAVSRLKDKPFFVDDRSALRVSQIAATARRMHAKTPLKLIVVDYIQLMEAEGKSPNERISSITKGLKALAKDLNCPVVALSQLNRNCESRTDKRPMMSDLRDSGSIEQDADLICFVYRDERYNENTAEKGIAELIWSKYRNGVIGTDRVCSRLEISRFDDLAYGYEPPEYTGPTDNKSKSTGMDC
ncbi:MAG: replicative DNA helicase [Spongiibacteraceae bacterium]|nr:replicative DNA helicase [Spongiibacteraceae bacterium]|tara:strand:+ start:3818 stop:5242 length:1425 start_codon:yes stop_codon:yes gene_type:complete